MTDNTYYHDVTGIPTTSQGAQEAATEAATDGAQDCAPAANTAAEEAQDASQGTTEGAADGVETVSGEVEINTPVTQTEADRIRAKAAGDINEVIYDHVDYALQAVGVDDATRDAVMQQIYTQTHDLQAGLVSLNVSVTNYLRSLCSGIATLAKMCEYGIDSYLEGLDPEKRSVEGEALDKNGQDAWNQVKAEANVENAFRAKTDRFVIPKDITENGVVLLLTGDPARGIHGILPDGMLCMVSMYSDPGKAEIMVRNDGKDSDNYGIYTVARPRGMNELKRIIYEIAGARDSHFINTVFDALPARLKLRKMSHDPDRWVPCDNGVYDLQEDRFIEYDSDEYKQMDLVFCWKHHTRYNEHAGDVVPVYTDEDGNTIDLEQVISDMAVDEFGDPCEGTRQLLWEVLDTVTRPGVKRGKVAVLQGKLANDGKSTLRKLAIAVTGEANVCTFQPSAFEKDFALASLVNPSYKPLIYPDDTSFERIEKSANFKSFITNDPIHTDQKYGDEVTINTDGMSMILNCNSLPGTREKGNEITRRLKLIPMCGSFGNGRKEIKGIKKAFMERPDVAEYVIYKCIHMEHHDAYTETEESAAAMEEWIDNNDPVAAYMHEMCTPRVYTEWGEEDPTAHGNFRLLGIGNSYGSHVDTYGEEVWDRVTPGRALVVVEWEMTGVYYDRITVEENYASFRAWYEATGRGREGMMPLLAAFTRGVNSYLSRHPGLWEKRMDRVQAGEWDARTNNMDPMQAVAVDAINEYARMRYQQRTQHTCYTRCKPTRVIRKYSLGLKPGDPRELIYGEDDDARDDDKTA